MVRRINDEMVSSVVTTEIQAQIIFWQKDCSDLIWKTDWNNHGIWRHLRSYTHYCSVLDRMLKSRRHKLRTDGLHKTYGFIVGKKCAIQRAKFYIQIFNNMGINRRPLLIIVDDADGISTKYWSLAPHSTFLKTRIFWKRVWFKYTQTKKFGSFL